MPITRSIRGFRTRMLLGAVCLMALWGGPVPGENPPASLTAKQREQLKERDRCAALARDLQAQGKPDEAIAAAEKAVSIAREVPGGANDSLAQSLQLLATLQEVHEDLATARKVRAEVLAIQIKIHGEQDWRVTDARLALAYTERLAGLKPEQRQRLAEARKLDQKCRQLYRQGRYREALPPGQEVLEIYTQVLGEDHQWVGAALNTLALQYKNQGDLERAETMYRRACAVGKKNLGESHPSYGTELSNLGIVCVAREKYAEAEPILRQAAAILTQVHGPKDRRTAWALEGLIDLYGKRGNKNLADGASAEAQGLSAKVGCRHAALRAEFLASRGRTMGIEFRGSVGDAELPAARAPDPGGEPGS